MKKISICFVTVSLAILVAGCTTAGYVPPVAFAPNQEHTVKTIGLVQPMSPPGIVIINSKTFEAMGQSGQVGILPLLIAADITSHESKKMSSEFAKSIEGVSLDYRQLVSESLTQRLIGLGYTVTEVKTTTKDAAGLVTEQRQSESAADSWPYQSAQSFVSDPRLLEGAADAFLDTAVYFFGFPWDNKLHGYTIYAVDRYCG